MDNNTFALLVLSLFVLALHAPAFAVSGPSRKTRKRWRYVLRALVPVAVRLLERLVTE